MFASVFPLLTARAFEEPFDYRVPDELAATLRRGSLVAVPLAGRTVLGLVLDRSDSSAHAGKTLPVSSVVDVPPVPGELLDLARTLAGHYLTSLGSALALVAPPAAAVHLERWVELTDAGRAALADGARGTAALQAYVGGAAARGRAAHLAALRRRGWVTVSHRVRVRHDRGRSPLVQRGRAGAKALGARQRAALALVERRGTLPAAELRATTGLGAAGLSKLLERDILRLAAEGGPATAVPVVHGGRPPVLLPEQERALERIVGLVGRGEEVLLHGVTGSGKTEVYLRAAEAVLRSGHGVLYLVPEIALTGQTLTRIRERFPGERIAVLHSGLSAGERLSAYIDAATGRVRLVVGARSAVFAPLRGLGLIVLDEEHDTSYKQDNDPRYDARTVARWRAQATGAVLVGGSATPSIEAFARIDHHADLARRVDGSQPPRMELVNMRDVPTLLAPSVTAALTGAVESGDKVIVFLNRRGYASLLACRHCGHSWQCPRCDVGLALFVRGRRLRCRLCGHAQAAPDSCPECGGVDLARFGTGTEAVERELASLLPGIAISRLDSDAVSSATHLHELLEDFATPGPRVMVGTQMVAKGHHFPDVTLVVVVDADVALRFPDFRAEERTYAMLVQVAGRSGRGERGGRVLVQTLDPEARPIALAAAGEHERFYREEVERRGVLGYPPATTLVAVEVSAPEAQAAQDDALAVAARLRRALRDDQQLLGPGPLSRERGRYVARLVIKSARLGVTLEALRRGMPTCRARLSRGSRLVVDVEPQWM